MVWGEGAYRNKPSLTLNAGFLSILSHNVLFTAVVGVVVYS